MPCVYCRKGTPRRRGLCWECYYTPEIRTLYFGPRPKKAGPEEDPPCRKPPRKDGDPPFRCLWCNEYRCTERLKRCGDCDQEYAEAARGLPEFDPSEVVGE